MNTNVGNLIHLIVIAISKSCFLKYSILLGSLFVCRQSAAQRADFSNLPPPSNKQIEFLQDIKPILAKHCHACHGPDKQENELRFDVKEMALKGGTSGPAIVPGKSDGSRMIHLVAGLEKDLVMPKKGARLTSEQIGLLRAWIDQGAQWPDQAGQPKGSEKSDWWSFKPATLTAPPQPRAKTWARNSVDLFVLDKLEREKLSPAPEAGRRTLIRRLNYDLTGLPPKPSEVREFENDPTSDAYERLVDRLLDSPRHGERWARHWLDVVHYGETHGYDKDKPRPNAWPYRDYVIRSFNQDKSYSRFVQEQLAGDVLFPDEPDGIVALGFIAAGPWDFVGHVELPVEKTDGLIARYNDRDDMVMTAMSTFQSLTVHCARCHNHKFDPIQQKEYYGLQAVFAGVDRADRPFDQDKSVHVRRRPLTREKTGLENQLATLTNKLGTITSPELEKLDAKIKEVAEKFSALGDPHTKSPGNGYHSGIEKTADQTKWVRVDLGSLFAIDEIRLVPARPVDFPDTPGFGFPVRFRIGLFATSDLSSPETITDQTKSDFPNPGDNPVSFNARGKTGRFIQVSATRLWERTSDFVFALGELQVFVNGTNAAYGAEVSSMDSIEGGLWSGKLLVDNFDSRKWLGTRGPADGSARDREQLELQTLRENRQRLHAALIPVSLSQSLTRITNELNVVKAELASLPPQQNVYAAANDFAPSGSFLPPKIPRPVHLLGRGEVKRPGELMSAMGIAAVPGPDADFGISNREDEGARRAALARWITDPRNMLTRRSIVNRIWHHHFGRGIVETPNDFGHMGALPTHPELLDWLAFWFQENGESFKKLHRLIVTSATYRQGSDIHSGFEKIDGDNRYLWRMNRSRLDAEAIRDSMLFVSDKLDLTMGGPSVKQFQFKDDHSPVYDYAQFDVASPAAYRRSIYRFVVRSVPDPMMDSLDCPDASLLTPKRNTTMTALQALTVLNNPFVLKQCEHLASRVAKAGDLASQITEIYRLTINREPSAAELEKLVSFAKNHGLPGVCRIIFNLSEFMFVD